MKRNMVLRYFNFLVIVPFTPIDDNSLVSYNDDLPSYSPEKPSYIVDQPIYTDPLPSYNEAEEYGAPVKPVLDLASYTEEEYGAPIKPVLDLAGYNEEKEQYGAPIQPVITGSVRKGSITTVLF